MYEKHTIHAIAHTKEKGLQNRFRHYSSKKERDETFDILEGRETREADPIEKVTLTITVESVTDQLSLGI